MLYEVSLKKDAERDLEELLRRRVALRHEPSQSRRQRDDPTLSLDELMEMPT